MRACFIAAYNEMLRFIGTTKHLSQAAQSLKNNLTGSQDLKGFIKIELLKMKFQFWHLKYEATLKRSHKRGERGSLEIHPLQCLSLLQGCLFSGRKKSPG